MIRASCVGALVSALMGCSGADRGNAAAGASDRWARDARVPAGGDLDADAAPIARAAPVVINEVVADSPEGDAVELLNLSDAPVDLSGYFVTDDPDAAPQRALLPVGTIIGPRAYLTLAVGAATLGFGLGSDEAFALSAPDGRRVDLADWSEGEAPMGRSWGRTPDGIGGFATLSQATLGGPNAAPASAPLGTMDAGPTQDAAHVPEPVTTSALIVNEVVAEGGPEGDWVELYNPTDVDAPLDGLFLTDDFSGAPLKGALPPGWIVPARAWFALPVDEASLGFKLSSDEEVTLVEASGARIDGADWSEGDAPAGTSWGRWPDHTGTFRTLQPTTRGAPNSLETATPLVINEVVAAGDPDDVVELYNGTFEDIDLMGYAVSDDPEGEPLLVTLEESLVVPARGFALLVVSDERLGFKLGSAEGFSLSDPTGALVDSTFWTEGQSPADGAWARDPDGTGPFRSFALSTLGAPNAP